MSTNSSMLTELKNAVTDQGEPLSKREPGAPFVVVSLVYPGILTICLLLFALTVNFL